MVFLTDLEHLATQVGFSPSAVKDNFVAQIETELDYTVVGKIYRWPYATRTFSGPFLLLFHGFSFKRAQNPGNNE